MCPCLIRESSSATTRGGVTPRTQMDAADWLMFENQHSDTGKLERKMTRGKNYPKMLIFLNKFPNSLHIFSNRFF